MRITSLKQIGVFCLVLCLAFCICAVNADSGEAEFIGALEQGINADALWGALIPVAGIIIFTFVFAFAYQLIKKVLKKGSKGKFGM